MNAKQLIAGAFSISLCLSEVSAQPAFSKQFNALPLYKPADLKSARDWLISPVAGVSALYRTAEGSLAFSNGLITRGFSITPNCATIALDNLRTDEALVRAVSPEAILWINNRPVKVGGLVGQPIKNYLLPSWLKQMKADSQSLKMVSWETGPLKERFPYHQQKPWLSQQQTWPSKGMELVFTFKADEAMIGIMKSHRGDGQRQLVWTDDFVNLAPEWKVVNGVGENKMTFTNEGKAGEMLGKYENTAFGELPLSPDVKVVVCKLNSGTDLSTGYGPGIALVYGDGKNIKFYLSPGNKQFALYNKGSSASFPGFHPDRDCYLRVEMRDGTMDFGVSEDGEKYTTLASIPAVNRPVALRVGKTDPTGSDIAGTTTGPNGRSKIQGLSLFGDQLTGSWDYLENLVVKVHYELYDGVPVLGKWVTVENHSNREIILNNISIEQLSVTEAESAVERNDRWMLPPIFAQSDFAFHSMAPNASDKSCIEWKPDPSYTTQVNYELKTPVVLECKPKHGVGQEITANKPFESMRLWELLYDSYDRERRGLEQRKMYRTIAPWVTENPITFHVSTAGDEAIKKAIDQCAETGFELLNLSWGVFHLEDTSAANIARGKMLREYASSKKIGLGSYSLLASRSIDSVNDVVMPNPMVKPIFDHSPCLLSNWGINYFKTLYNLYEKTGMTLLEHDGSYPGDICASTSHPGHRGLEDSQWKQFAEIRDFYKWCRSKGIMLNVPDWYFLAGSSKIAMGYRETDWSLPRAYQEIIERQNVYDGTWEKTPSMGWMFVPLVQYHGGGEAATIEPLREHLPHYSQRMADLLGAGVQACYRGTQIYDSPETLKMVKGWISFYKQHRRILESDIIHIRRPDGRDYDAILHADPTGTEKGFLMVYNPMEEPITRIIDVDLYYTGLSQNATMSENGQNYKSVKLNGTKARIKVTIPAKNQSWFIFK